MEDAEIEAMLKKAQARFTRGRGGRQEAVRAAVQEGERRVACGEVDRNPWTAYRIAKVLNISTSSAQAILATKDQTEAQS